MGRTEVTKIGFREENFGNGGEGFGFKKGNICKVKGIGGEKGEMQRYVFRKERVGKCGGGKGSKPLGMEGPEQENRGNDSDIDGIIEEEWEYNIDEDEIDEYEVDENDITGVIKLIEIENPEFGEDVKEAKEIRRSTKKRKKLADELGELLFLMV